MNFSVLNVHFTLSMLFLLNQLIFLKSCFYDTLSIRNDRTITLALLVRFVSTWTAHSDIYKSKTNLLCCLKVNITSVILIF